jgi:hypothetical protein
MYIFRDQFTQKRDLTIEVSRFLSPLPDLVALIGIAKLSQFSFWRCRQNEEGKDQGLALG